MADFTLENFTLQNYSNALIDPETISMVGNSFVFAIGSTLVALVLGGVVAYLVAGRVLAQLERGPAAGLVEEFQPQPDPGRPSGAGYRADVGVRDQQFILDDLVQCHIDRRAASRVRVAHQHKTQETTGPGVAFRRLARHGETRGPEPLAQLVGIDKGPVDQFARRVEDAGDGDFPTLAHRRQPSAAPGWPGWTGQVKSVQDAALLPPNLPSRHRPRARRGKATMNDTGGLAQLLVTQDPSRIARLVVREFVRNA